MKTVKIELIIERQENQAFWGRVKYNEHLIVEQAATIAELEDKIKYLLKNFEDLDPNMVDLEHKYDIYALFQRFDFLKISNVAKHAGMNPGLLRQYASGVKSPSAEQAKKIEETIHRLAHDMQEAFIYTANKEA